MQGEHTMKNKLSIPLLIALVGLPQISETIYTPSLPNVAQGLSTTAQLVEATLAIYFIGFAIGVSLWGIVSDLIGRRMTMLMGLCIYGTATYFCGNAATIETLLTWRIIQAFGASVGSVITQTILRDAFDGSERSKLFSIMSGALAFSPAVGPLMGGLISQFLGWRANFWILVIVALVLFIWSFLTLPETRAANTKPLSTDHMIQLFKQMLTSSNLWGHILLISATNGIIFGFYQEAPFLFIQQLNISPSHYGLIGILIATASIIAARVSFKWGSHSSSEIMINNGTKIVILGSCLFLLCTLIDMQQNFQGVLIILTAIFMIFFGIGLIIPNSLSHALKPYQSTVGTAGSIFGGTYYCLIAGFTWLMSEMHNGQALPLPLYFLFMGSLLITACLLLAYSRKVAQITIHHQI